MSKAKAPKPPAGSSFCQKSEFCNRPEKHSGRCNDRLTMQPIFTKPKKAPTAKPKKKPTLPERVTALEKKVCSLVAQIESLNETAAKSSRVTDMFTLY